MYYLVYGIFYLLSLLPWRVLYLVSDAGYAIVYYLVRYRRNVVMHNLKIAFPEKTDTERKRIAKDFYKNFADNFMEVIKLVSISEKELNRRFTCDYNVVNDLYITGKNVQLLSGHFFNWEFANLAFSNNFVYPLICVYMPVTNKIFDRLFRKMRSRFGSRLVAATEFARQFVPFTRGRYVCGLVGDQSPGGPDNVYWTRFFGRMTPFVKGPEKGAVRLDAAVVLSSFIKVKRGYYRCKLKLLTADPKSLHAGDITRQMIAFIEETVRKYPANYLWSHRRWKWEFEEDKYVKNVI